MEGPRAIYVDDKVDERVPLGTLFSQAVDEGKAFVGAEVALYKAKAGAAAGEAKWVAIYLGAALIIALSTVTALLVGLIVALSTLVGPGWATLIVVVGALALAGLLGWLGIKHVSGVTKAVS